MNMRICIVTIHDACPFFSNRIFQLADELENLNIRFNIALIPFFNEKEDLTSFPDFIKKIKSYKDCELALHGLYHERRNGRFDDFHTVSKSRAEEEIRAGLEIFYELNMNPQVFIPPAWKLNENSIEILKKVGFDMTETQERLLLLSYDSCKKIKVPKVFNWDSTGYPEKNTINIDRDEKRFKILIKQIPPIIRIALHPRDPHNVLKEQKDMISKLIESEYKVHRYREVLPKLQKLALLLSNNDTPCLENSN
jgi:predicted deacetylase